MASSSAIPNIAEVQSLEVFEDSSSGKDDHNIQVIIRLRPLSSSEISSQESSKCIKKYSNQSVTWAGHRHPKSRFTFDMVADESVSQEMLFKVAGKPMVENCISGYNSCMFAYGQTGSGKTHTMLGDIEGVNCGMTPRVFEYLFSRIQKATVNQDKQREKEVQGLKKRGKKSLEDVASGKISAETHFLKEKEKYLQEIEVLRSQLVDKKDVTELAMENQRLNEEIKRLKLISEEGDSERLNEGEDVCSGLRPKVKELESKLRELEHRRKCSTYQEKVKYLEKQLKERGQESLSTSVALEQKFEQLERNLREQEHSTEFSMLRQKIAELEEKLREQEKRLQSQQEQLKL